MILRTKFDPQQKVVLKLKLIRDTFTETETLGKLYIDDKYFCETLEDPVRAGAKVQNETAIPYGVYSVITTFSSHFKREMALVYNSFDLSVTAADGTLNRWVGIRIHGGNTHADTQGCILVAYTRKTNVLWKAGSSIKNWITGTAEKELTKKLIGAGKSELTIL